MVDLGITEVQRLADQLQSDIWITIIKGYRDLTSEILKGHYYETTKDAPLFECLLDALYLYENEGHDPHQAVWIVSYSNYHVIKRHLEERGMKWKSMGAGVIYSTHMTTEVIILTEFFNFVLSMGMGKSQFAILNETKTVKIDMRL